MYFTVHSPRIIIMYIIFFRTHYCIRYVVAVPSNFLFDIWVLDSTFYRWPGVAAGIPSRLDVPISLSKRFFVVVCIFAFPFAVMYFVFCLLRRTPFEWIYNVWFWIYNSTPECISVLLSSQDAIEIVEIAIESEKFERACSTTNRVLHQKDQVLLLRILCFCPLSFATRSALRLIHASSRESRYHHFPIKNQFDPWFESGPHFSSCDRSWANFNRVSWVRIPWRFRTLVRFASVWSEYRAGPSRLRLSLRFCRLGNRARI